MKRLFLALLLAIALPAAAQTATWKVDKPSSCAVVCTAIEMPPGPPGPPPPVEPPAPPSNACSRATDAKFQAALLERPLPELYTIMLWRVGRGLTADELACARERGVPGMETKPPPSEEPPAPPLARCEGFEVVRKGCPYRNRLDAGSHYHYAFDVASGERVEITILELVGTPDSMMIRSQVFAPTGAITDEVLSGKHGKHVIDSAPCTCRLVLRLIPLESGPLGVQRN